MAITGTKQDWNMETCSLGEPRQEVTYMGRVLRVYHRDYRAMSDVYTWATFAEVVEDDGKVAEVLVNANFECDQSGRHAEVDADAWALGKKAEHDAEVARQIAAREAARLQAAREAEKHRPVPGKQMVVAKGRKVPIGTVGTVAFVSGSGSVLLKADHEWKDRKANGTWIDARNLRARA